MYHCRICSLFFWTPKCITVLSEGLFSHSDPSWMWTKYPALALPKGVWSCPNVVGFKPVPSVSPYAGLKGQYQRLHRNQSPGSQQEKNTTPFVAHKSVKMCNGFEGKQFYLHCKWLHVIFLQLKYWSEIKSQPALINVLWFWV